MFDFKKNAITNVTKLAKLVVSVGTIAVLPILIPAQDLYQGAGSTAKVPEIKDEDFEEIYKSIVVENFPYSTPVIFSKEEVFDLLRTIRGDYANA